MKLTFGDGSPVDFRMTWLFHREERDWKAVQIHASNPMSNREALGRELTTSIEEVADFVERERPDLNPVASPEGTVTIMFTDIEASTATNEALGDNVFLPLLLRHNEIVRSQTESAGGTVVKSQGDGFMLAFPSARRGVECAIAVQQDVSAFDAPLKVRMGLHTGEPVREADDFYGRDVAYAARIGSAWSSRELVSASFSRRSCSTPSNPSRVKKGSNRGVLTGRKRSRPLPISSESTGWTTTCTTSVMSSPV